MSEQLLYKNYFDIDPNYYSAVNADLIRKGLVSWKHFYPHCAFMDMLKATYNVLSGKEAKSLWLEGAYGTGKSHAALTVKSLLEAPDEDVRSYFDTFGLDRDLCQKILTVKNNGKLIVVYREGSSAIFNDQQLVLAVQNSIVAALREHGIERNGQASLKEAMLNWLKDNVNREYMGKRIQQDKYVHLFAGMSIDAVIQRLESQDEDLSTETLLGLMKIAEGEGFASLGMDVEALAVWIRDVLKEQNVTLFFVWDEFTEFFLNNPRSLTGFQTLIQLSSSAPFYFMIVTHLSSSLMKDAETTKKILARFVPPIKIELPDNMALSLMAEAMRTSNDPAMAKEWADCKADLNHALNEARTIIASGVRNARLETHGKTGITDEELQNIVPIHPYAALVLKHISTVFKSNQRSMFDFIISEGDERKGFKWYINQYGPIDTDFWLLTIDMLWNFFYSAGRNGLNEDVRGILDVFDAKNGEDLLKEEQRVLKTELMLEAISKRVSSVAMLRPTARNIDLAFSGLWVKGKANAILGKLCKDGLMFSKTLPDGQIEYNAAQGAADSSSGELEKIKERLKKETTIKTLIINADLMQALPLQDKLGRFVLEPAYNKYIQQTVNRVKSSATPDRFQIIVTFALNDDEAASVKDDLLKQAENCGEMLFINAGLTPMGNSLFEQYIENMAYSLFMAKSNKGQAAGYQKQAEQKLDEWKNNIQEGAFELYSMDYPSGHRFPNLEALAEELSGINRRKYPYAPEQYRLADTMFKATQTAQGAECGITEELKGTFRSANTATSLATALAGAWGQPGYWKDPVKKSLAISRIKLKVEEIIAKGLSNASARISIREIYESLTQAPFGFMPNNVAAFLLGFVLKEYAKEDYFWSNGSLSNVLTVDRLKNMIADAIKQSANFGGKYKEEYIVRMSREHGIFLKETGQIFNISAASCSSIESARDQIRLKMMKFSFPIWCVKYALDNEKLITDRARIMSAIENYCGIANTANGFGGSESDIATALGAAFLESPGLANNLQQLLSNDKCHEGMLAYLDSFEDGILPKLAMEIEDAGAYLEQVRKKFSDAANWVWNIDTADLKIRDVIGEYKIIAESNKLLQSKSSSLNETLAQWNSRTGNIRIACEALSRYVGDLAPFLQMLCKLKQSGTLPEQQKESFYRFLCEQGNAFNEFYKDQERVFREVVAKYAESLDESDIGGIFQKLPLGQFTKSRSEYFRFIESQVNNFMQSQSKKKMRDLWLSKTQTKDPVDWSAQYGTPILCMFTDDERPQARGFLGVLLQSNPPENEVNKTIEYLERATFFDHLNDAAERDRCFMELVVGEYNIMLNDADKVRDLLRRNITETPYYWLGSSSVKRQLKTQAEKIYETGGADLALAVVETMDAESLRHYLHDFITNNLTVGMEIIRNSQKRG